MGNSYQLALGLSILLCFSECPCVASCGSLHLDGDPLREARAWAQNIWLSTGDVQDLGRGSVDGPEAQSLEITDAWYTPKVPNHSKQHFTGVPVAIDIGEPQPSMGFEAKTIITPYDAKFTG